MLTTKRPEGAEQLSLTEQIEALKGAQSLENFLSKNFPEPASLVNCSDEEYDELSHAIFDKLGDLGLKILNTYCDKIFNEGGDDNY